MTPNPDLFRNVHKGLRKAMFDTCIALGRAGDEPARALAARAQLQETLRFLERHGENEDLLLLPLLRERAPAVFERMTRDHGQLGLQVAELSSGAETWPVGELYERFSRFISLYLEHMREEEQEHEPHIRAALSAEEQSGFGRRSVERTAPAEQRMMLGWMLAALPRSDVEALVARLPPQLAAQLAPSQGGQGCRSLPEAQTFGLLELPVSS